ncbi:histidine kinase [Mucilaginibacter robiniae]|uniref:Histidine kinase n=1 Tax=Mucilaginibacter robiniae TaxID=2728022 RepID=A0A7L5DZ04_9SPHI|nr:histidine kinase [Mucilaginibacter robiniae]QJD95269.1 histidine kinase [Mucilaginibacter robiniae]
MKKLIGKPWLYNTIPVVIWFLLLVLPFLSGPANIPAEAHRHFLITTVTSNFLLLCIFYVHTYFIYPLLSNKSTGWYIVSNLVIVALYLLYWKLLVAVPHQAYEFSHQADSSHMAHQQFGPPPGGPRYYMPILSVFIALLCSFCYRVILDDASRRQLLQERETVHLQTELNFLRSQISPHFMFNILNNLVALARKKSDELEPAIVNLSQLMRYMLYESDDNKVQLTKEIEYLKSYIKLQMLRFGNEVKVHLNVSGNPDLYTIEPMLLIPFVENAFKHGTGMIEQPLILISLNIQEDENRTLQFKVVNAISTLDVSKDKSSGIGLSNVQRRLAILYPGRHSLNISSQNNSFTTELTIHLGS